LGGGNQPGVESLSAAERLHDLLAFCDDALNGLALNTRRLFLYGQSIGHLGVPPSSLA
jgi:hypothetical protein